MAIDPNNLAGTAHVTFDDEFNALSLWSPTNTSGTWETTWWYADPNGNGGTLASNGEQEWYINSNYGPTSSVKPWTVSNGVLTLTAAPASSSVSSLINGYGYTSGEINSYHSFNQEYGYFEMKAQLPSGQGFWPAFWLMPTDGSWPPELDVMEVLGQNPTQLFNTVHTMQTGTHVAIGDGANGGVTVADMSAGYHTFGVDWESDAITWYFDGKAVFQTATPADMHKPMYMIANLADGGYWPGGANGQTGKMNIDYIRAYASGAAAGVTTPTPTPTSTATPTPTPTPAPTPTPTATVTGQTFTSDNNGDHWTGTSGNDLFHLGRGGDVVTGNGGNDTFAYASVPWGAGTITDFNAGDVLDLTGMLADQHYSGSDPIGAGYLKITSDSAGNAQVWANYNQTGNSGWWLVDTLKGVAASSLTLSGGRITTSGATTALTSATSSSATPSATPTTTASGQTFTSDNYGDHWTGTAGNDVFNLGRGADVVTGAGGADTFVYHEYPWAVGHITDFGTDDVLDVSPMLARYGYTGSNPVADGRLQFVSDGAGGTQVVFHGDGLPAGNLGTWVVTDLDHVAPASLTNSGGRITETASTASSTGVAGQTFTSDNNGDHWTGTAGNDTFNVGRGGDVLTGNGGNDIFAYAQVPWGGSHITDFNTGDTIDLTGLMKTTHDTGTDGFADGYLKITSDSAGNAQVWANYNLPGNNNWWMVVTLDHEAASNLHTHGAFITG